MGGKLCFYPAGANGRHYARYCERTGREWMLRPAKPPRFWAQKSMVSAASAWCLFGVYEHQNSLVRMRLKVRVSLGKFDKMRYNSVILCKINRTIDTPTPKAVRSNRIGRTRKAACSKEQAAFLQLFYTFYFWDKSLWCLFGVYRTKNQAFPVMGTPFFYACFLTG